MSKEDSTFPKDVNHLIKGQNFFEQTPFNHLGLIAETRKLDVRKLRALLPYVHDFERATNLAGSSDEEAKRIIDREKELIDQLVDKATQRGVTGRLKKGSNGFLQRYYAFRNAFAEMALYLKDFPDWFEYKEKYTGQHEPWNGIGEPIPSFRWFPGLQVPTYIHWPIEKKQKAAFQERVRRNQILLGIDEIFPQQITQQDIREIIARGGKKGSNREWATKKASDLTK